MNYLPRSFYSILSIACQSVQPTIRNPRIQIPQIWNESEAVATASSSPPCRIPHIKYIIRSHAGQRTHQTVGRLILLLGERENYYRINRIRIFISFQSVAMKADSKHTKSSVDHTGGKSVIRFNCNQAIMSLTRTRARMSIDSYQHWLDKPNTRERSKFQANVPAFLILWYGCI